MRRSIWTLGFGIGMTVTWLVAFGAEQPRDFAMTIPLATAGTHSHFEVSLPATVYEGVVHPDLADVRVFNGQGEPVPIAVRPRALPRVTPPTIIALTPFALRGAAVDGADAAIIRLERRGDQLKLEMKAGKPSPNDALLGYLVDTSNIKQPIGALRFDTDGVGDISTAVRVQATDDLKFWQTVATDAPLLRLEAGGQRLVHDRIEFPARVARYWRIDFIAPRRAVAIRSITAELAEGMLQPARHLRELTGTPVADKPGDVMFDANGQFPIERVRVVAPQINSVAIVEIFSRAKASDAWIKRASGTVFRLARDGVETTSPPMPVPPLSDRYWLVRVDQRGGGFGAGVPGLAIEWRPHQLIFVARGAGPFQLVFGSAIARSALMPLEALLPATAGTATAAVKIDAVVAKAEAGEVQAMAGDRARTPPFQWRIWILWASILAAVAMLAWMAWRLARQLKSSAPSESV